MKESKLVWNEKTLDRFLADPLKTIPGTTMTAFKRRSIDLAKRVGDYNVSLASLVARSRVPAEVPAERKTA
jgi:hypothetical protein